MILGVHHMTLTTPAIDRLRQFYLEAFGFHDGTR